MIKDELEKKISAIIPSNNNEKIINTIKSIRSCVDEIIIVNSAKDDCVIPQEYNAKIIQCNKGKTNASKARNIGATEAQNEILLFIDADVEVDPSSIKYFKESFEKMSETDIYGGLYDFHNKSNIVSNINSLLLRYRVNVLNKNKNFKIISSSHFIIKKKFFKKIGEFNENLDSYEDCDFFVRAQKIFNANLIVNEKLNVYHLKEYNFINLILETVKKTFYFTKIRLLFKNYYKNVTTLLDWKINILSLPIFFLFLGFLFLESNSLPLLLYIASIFIISFISINIFRNFKNSLFGTFIISFVAIFSYLSASFAILYLLVDSIIKSLRKIRDLIICSIKVIFKYGKPIQLIQYVTSRCNLRCDHCFYKETLDRPDPGELPVDVLVSSAKQSGPLLWYSLAGGEPFIRKDFSDIVLGIKKEARPIVISLPSNGWYTERTYLSCLKIMQNYHDGLFVIFISIDGPQQIHDNIRGENSFKKLKETFEVLKKLSKLYERLHINIVITVQDFNYNCFPGTIKDLYNEFEPTSISINLFRYHDLNGPKVKPEIIKGYESAIKEYDEIRIRKSYGLLSNAILKAKEKVQKDLILSVAKENKFVTTCSAGNLSYVSMEDGSLKPCEILKDTLGTIKTSKVNMNKMFFSSEAKNLRKKIINTKCKCTFECAMSSNVLFNGNMVPKIINQTVKDVLKKN